MFLCSETEAVYESKEMQEYITYQTLHHSKQWVYEILEGQRESSQVAYRDPEGAFVLLPSLCETNLTKTKSFIAIFADRSLRCLRDLRGHHIETIRRVKDTCLEKLGGIRDHWYCTVHYHPSVYQLHFHFRQHNERNIARVFSVDDVLDNLTADSDFYKKAVLSFSISSSADMFRYKKNVLIRKIDDIKKVDILDYTTNKYALLYQIKNTNKRSLGYKTQRLQT